MRLSSFRKKLLQQNHVEIREKITPPKYREVEPFQISVKTAAYKLDLKSAAKFQIWLFQKSNICVVLWRQVETI